MSNYSLSANKATQIEAFKLITHPLRLQSERTIHKPLLMAEQAKCAWGETGSARWKVSVWGGRGVDFYCNQRQPREDLLWWSAGPNTAC